MTDHHSMIDHPISPPPELVQQWYDAARGPRCEHELATQAYRAGADQELEACCEWLVAHGWFGSSNHDAIRGLRAARRPKPPSLAEQALDAWTEMDKPLDAVNASRCYAIRRALERLQELENND